jgi:hemoglobin
MAEAAHPWGTEATPFDALGGEERIRTIVDDFYDTIESDAPTLREMLPANDSVSRDKLYAYLVEWTGGPALYTPERGHPMLRARHLPFPIGEDEVDQWLECMAKALDNNEVDGDVRVFLDDRMTSLAGHMRNR